VVLLPGSIDHYTISNIRSPQGTGIPFSVIVQAQDLYNNNITTGTETLNLTFGQADTGATPLTAITSSGKVTISNMIMAVVQIGQSITFTGATSGKSGISNYFDVIVEHRITANAGANGQISPTGTVIVNDGNNQAFTITPNTGYHVADVLVDGTSVGAVTTYTFTDVVADHTIAASFSGLPVVASQAATNITISGATLNGSLSDKGNTSGAVTVSF
jgi:hypothetical protein